MSQPQDALICDVYLTGINSSLDKEFPKLLYQKTNNCHDISNLTRNYGSENFWYEIADHLLKNRYFKHLQTSEKRIVPLARSTLANTNLLYGKEENFISTKILPNVPQHNLTLNCSGITKLQKWERFDRTALIGFYGSGNHMLW